MYSAKSHNTLSVESFKSRFFAFFSCSKFLFMKKNMLTFGLIITFLSLLPRKQKLHWPSLLKPVMAA